MSFLQWLDSQPWTRPGIAALAGVAYLVQSATPPWTVAHKIANVVLGISGSAGLGSLGASATNAKDSSNSN